MSDLRGQEVQHQHTEAITRHLIQETKQGQAFIEAASRDADWYQPPRGRYLDTWA